MNPPSKKPGPETSSKQPSAGEVGAKPEGAAPESDSKQQESAGQSAGSKRKTWVKKSPTEIVLEQVKKQEEKVTQLKKELAQEEAELKKMQKAVEIFQAG